MGKVNTVEELWKAVDRGFSYVEEQCLWDEYYNSALAGSIIPFYEGGCPLFDEYEASGLLLMDFQGIDDFTVNVYIPDSDLTLMGSVRVTPELSVSDVNSAIDEMEKSGKVDNFVYIVSLDYLRRKLNEDTFQEIFLGLYLGYFVNELYFRKEREASIFRSHRR